MIVLKTIGWKTLLCVSCLALAGAWGCGDDGDDGNGGSNNGGGSDTSSFSAQVETDSGSQQIEGEQSDSKAGEGTWGASIGGSNLHVTLTSADGATVVSAVITTTESQKAPGDFTPQATNENTFVSIVSAAQGNAFMSTGSGTITLDNCPRAVGEHAKGSFNNVVLAAESGNATWTLDGSFDVVVFAKAGDLFCNEQSSGNNSTPGNNNTGGQCSADWCEDGGTCCPYMPCVSQCELGCFQSAECQGGLNPEACAACARGCLDECNVSDECNTAAVALNTCGENAGCDATETQEAEEQCLEQNCCSELNATL